MKWKCRSYNTHWNDSPSATILSWNTSAWRKYGYQPCGEGLIPLCVWPQREGRLYKSQWSWASCVKEEKGYSQKRKLEALSVTEIWKLSEAVSCLTAQLKPKYQKWLKKRRERRLCASSILPLNVRKAWYLHLKPKHISMKYRSWKHVWRKQQLSMKLKSNYESNANEEKWKISQASGKDEEEEKRSCM